MPLPVILPGFAAAKYYAGISLGATDWFEISQERVDQFGRATGADDWIHCDPERAARESPWKTAIAQGYLLLSLAPDLLPRLVVLLGWRTAVNAGADDCAFPAPAPVGSRVRMAASLARARTVPGGGVRLSFAVEFEVEGAADPACTARVHYLYFR
jgi:acyl dehydratase